MAPQLECIDTTLRDGAQAPGVVLAPHQRAAIASELARLGVDEIELGTAREGRMTIESCVEAIRQTGRQPRTAVCRAERGDVAQAVELPVSIIHISTGHERHRQLIGKRDWRFERSRAFCPRKRQKLSIGLMDASRAEWHALQAVDWATQMAWRVRLVIRWGLASSESDANDRGDTPIFARPVAYIAITIAV